MALVKCRECGKEVSNKANACPNCGAVINGPNWRAGRRAAAGCAFVLLALFVIFFLVVAVAISSSSKKSQTASARLGTNQSQDAGAQTSQSASSSPAPDKLAPLDPSIAAKIHNAACWRGPSDDLTRWDVSCTALTEQLFTKLQGATKDDVINAMGTIGNPNEDGLKFWSNYAPGETGGTGSVSFFFKDGKVVKIVAAVTVKNARSIGYFWYADGRGCSDFLNSLRRCNP